MLTKNQADAAADALMTRARVSQYESRFARGASIYRCRELAAFAPGQQKEIIQKAKAKATRNPYFILIVVACVGIYALVWIYGMSPAARGASTALTFIVCVGTPFLYHIVFARREVRSLAKGLAGPVAPPTVAANA